MSTTLAAPRPGTALPGQGDSETGFESLTPEQKLAALLLMVSPENAAHIMKSLDEDELETVASEMSKFTTISHELQMQILREFSSVAVEAGTAICGGVERTQSLLEKSVGLFRASDIVCRVSPLRAPVAAMQQIVEMDARHVYNLLRHEKIQTIALVTSYLSPDKAAQVLSLCRPEVRDQVIERLATIGPTSIEVVESAAEVLHRNFGNNRAQASNQTGGVKVAAQVLNALPKSFSKSFLVSLQERNPELEDAIRKKMFTFDEFERLDPKTLQKILQTVDLHTLTVALKTVSEKLKNTVLSCISKRAAENIREEIEFLGPLKLSEIEAAQTEIIETARRLEGEGEIDLESIRQKGRR